MVCINLSNLEEAQRCDQPCSDRHTKFDIQLGCNCVGWLPTGQPEFVLNDTCITKHCVFNHQCYRIKPHGQLVSVSLTHYCASTPDLSTSWSRTTLQGALGPGIPNLQTSFPLRCLQRLSLPYLATRQCHWHDNRYTRGTSTPVLSY